MSSTASQLKLVFSNSNKTISLSERRSTKLRMSRVTSCRSPQNTELLRKIAALIDRSPGHAAVFEKVVDKALRRLAG